MRRYLHLTYLTECFRSRKHIVIEDAFLQTFVQMKEPLYQKCIEAQSSTFGPPYTNHLMASFML